MGFMAVVSSVFGGGGIKDLVLGILDRVKLNPEKKAEIELELSKQAFEIQKIELELESKYQENIAKEIEASSSNILAEASSSDKFVSRSRPMFMYIIYVIIIWNFILLPIIQMLNGVQVSPIELPSDMYWLFAAGYLGYSGFRSLDKSGFKWNKGGTK